MNIKILKNIFLPSNICYILMKKQCLRMFKHILWCNISVTF